MKTFRRPFINILSSIAAIFLWFPSVVAQEDVAAIIRRSSEANNHDWAAVPNSTTLSATSNKGWRQDLHGHHDFWFLPQERLIAVNGRGLNDASRKMMQAERRAKKYEKAVAQEHGAGGNECNHLVSLHTKSGYTLGPLRTLDVVPA